jgi:hypothetical protein
VKTAGMRAWAARIAEGVRWGDSRMLHRSAGNETPEGTAGP